ncbi:MAG: alpha/beta fold hydrolase [Candidatus Odinarchaeota archaeon]
MVNCDRIHVHYEKRLPPSGTDFNRCLIFLHGGGGNGKLWHHQTDHFSRQHEVITVDLPGSGSSSKNIDHNMAIMTTAVTLHDLIDRRVVSKHVTLVGHSYAGSVMDEMLDDLPVSVDSIVFVDSTFIADDEEAKKRRAFASNLLTLPVETMARRIREWYGAMTGRKLPEKEWKLIMDALDQTDPTWLLQVMAATKLTQKRYERPVVDRQWMVTVGIIESDFFAGDNPQSWRNYFQQCYYCHLEGTAHFLFMEQPEEFNQCLERFVKQLV